MKKRKTAPAQNKESRSRRSALGNHKWETTKDRIDFTENTHIHLTNEVNGCCPKCGKPLLYIKGGMRNKRYDIAHIYPLNPTKSEELALATVRRLADDPNATINLIPLCKNCHRMFDSPRTAESYNDLRETKLRAVELQREKEYQDAYTLQQEISAVVKSLSSSMLPVDDPPIRYDAKRVDQKLTNQVPFVVLNDIRRNVQDYFGFVKREFLEIEKEQPGIFDVIMTQVRGYYLHQKMRGVPKDKIVDNTTEWFLSKTNAGSAYSCRILTSYFIQNCEVFE